VTGRHISQYFLTVTPLAAVVALVVGITLGLLGAGGSILTVPALIFALGVDPKVAIVMGLPIVGGAAAVGAGRQWMQGNIDLRVAVGFGIANMIGAYGGALLARGLNGEMQLLLLMFTMIAAAATMLLSTARLDARERAAGAPHAVSTLMLLLGLGSGALTGIVGIGGGFILVPVLVVLGGLSMREAAGTSLTVIAMNTASAFVGYRGVVEVPWMLVLMFGGATAIGVLIGGHFAKRVPEPVLKRGFGVLLLLVVGLLFWRLKSVF
jgi:uncharacterized membrane protein YfcA